MLAAEPPLISTAEPSARYSSTARSVSISSIEPLTSVVLGEERVAGVGDDVDEGVADADDVEAGGAGHGARDATAHGADVDRPGARRPATASARADAGTVGRVTATDVASPPTLDPYRLPRGAVPDALRRRAGARPRRGHVRRPGRDRRRRRRAGRRARAQRHRARHRSRSASTAATCSGTSSRTTERLVVSPVGGLQPGPVTRRRSPSPASSTTSCAASTAARSATTTGTEHVIATTQMQATDCRRAFPCWDEPDFKAVFGITLVVDPALLAVSNGPEVERTRAARRQGRRPLRRHDGDEHVPRRVRRRPARGHRAGRRRRHPAARRPRARQGPPHRRSASTSARSALRWFQDYYGIPYPSDKVDLLALPDFAAGAMENLGCITFRENLLLVDPATATQDEQQLVADVVAHELAHMWFGDLVTMRWWNGIWLNEAFATFMELAACDAYRPDWERWTTVRPRALGGVRDRLAAPAPARSSTRSARPPTARACSTCSRTRRAAPCCACSSSTSATERFRQGVSHYLAPARLREHRDQRPVGRHRGDQRRAGAADDGLVDLAARLPARLARRSTAASSCCASSASPSTTARSTPTPRRRRGSSRCTSAPAPTAITRAARRRRGARAARRPGGAGRRQRRRPRLLPRRLRATSCAAGSPARCSARSTRSSATTSSTTRGTRSSPGASPPPTS